MKINKTKGENKGNKATALTGERKGTKERVKRGNKGNKE